MSFKNIFFDLDGTLSDPKEGITNSYLFALSKLGITESNIEEIPKYFGAPLHEYFIVRHKLDSALAEQGIKYYREYYSVKGLYENFLYEGIENLLNNLCTKGKNLFLVSVKPTGFVNDILVHFKIEKYFTKIYGSDLTNINKSKEELIKNLLENEKLDPECCVMVGDRAFDVNGAKYNGIKSIAVTYGYGTVNELKDSNPDFLLNSVNELSNLLLK